MKMKTFVTFAMLVSVLECLHQPKCLIYRSSHRQVIYGNLAKCSIAIDDIKTSEKTKRLYQHLKTENTHALQQYLAFL